MKTLIETLLREFRDKLPLSLVRRNLTFHNIPNKIHVAMGMRRTGKTFFLYQTILDLLQQGIPIERIVYINFEDERLLPMTAIKLGELVKAYYELFPEHHDHPCYMFFDEIQNVSGWPIVLRRLHDQAKMHIYITGSSSKMLSKEISTSLRGRSMAVEVWPFSFAEYLKAKNISATSAIASSKQHDYLKKYLRDYLTSGGFPETMEISLQSSIALLQNYVQSVIFRDIVERHRVKHIELIKNIVHTFLQTPGTAFSVNKHLKHLKSIGNKVGKTTIHNYMAHIEDSYLAFSVPLFTPSYRQRNIYPRKIYAVDSGLYAAHRFDQQDAYGRLFENLIYLDLRRLGYDIFYYITPSGYEIDFVAQHRISKKTRLIQACYDAKHPATAERETRALAEAEKSLGLKGELVTPELYLRQWVKPGELV